METSSHGVLSFIGGVDTRAPNGQAGTALLDPASVAIDATCISIASCVTTASITTGLQTGNFIVTTGGNITVDSNVSLTWATATTLTLSAFDNITFQSDATISNTGAGNLILRADNTGTQTSSFHGKVNLVDRNQIDFSRSTGTVSIYYDPKCDCGGTKYQNALDYSSNVSTHLPNQLTAYMLVNSANDLALISSNLTGHYALGRDIDASSFSGFTSGTTFDGLLDGNGGLGVISTIDNLTLSLAHGSDSFGLFPFIGSSGIVRNLNLANVTITAGADIQFIGALAGTNQGTINNVTVLSGSVNGGTYIGIGAGGLVGQNNPGGTITGSSANVTVTMGNSTDPGEINYAGGLVGINMGTVTGSSATGNVGGGLLSIVGGLVGQNGLNPCGGCNPTGPGTITSSFATGAVTTSYVGGGFLGTNDFGTVTNSYATGNVSLTASSFGDFTAGGFVGINKDTIQGVGQFTYATGAVTGTTNSIVGGFAGQNQGSITFAYASGPVHVGSDSYAGGFFAFNAGTIFQAFATGTVTDDGNTVLGGFGAFNIGVLTQVFATGAVTGGTNTVVGGLVGVNAAVDPNLDFPYTVGQIVDAYATGAASGGGGSIVAGLVAVNDGVIKTSYSAGAVSGGNTGGLVAQNNSGFQFASLGIPNIAEDNGPIPLQPGSGAITNSYWNTETSDQPSSAGGTGMTSAQLAAGLPPGFDPNVWTILPDPSFPYFPWSPIIPSITLPPPNNPNVPPQPQIINNLTGGLTLVSLPPSVNVLPYPPPPPPPPGPQIGGEPRLFAIPPRGETRFVMDEVLLMVDCDTPQSALDTAARELRLSIIGSQCLMQTHMNLVRLHINSGQKVADVIRALARYRIVALAQANFIYHTMQDRVAQERSAQEERVAQDLAQDPDLAGRTQEGDAAQYALGKLGLIDIHRLIKGTNISIAVIDSQIDIHHPDMDGVFADQYDAVGGAAEKPHPHGTGMAGAIAAHRKLMGIAPAARIYAIHAFSSNAASADSTTFNILKGLDWAATKGVRVINMSFAGPRDPSMERALKNAHDKGIVLIAAAGNAGPKSPPLFPGADPNVIAVTATDSNDKIFSGANRGRYIAVAAPGVDILVPAPDDTYQLTTGTSVSSAEVSGIVALLLERNPNLGPEDIRKILTTSAKHPGAKERDDDFGSGLVDPSKAIQDAGEIKPLGQPAKR